MASRKIKNTVITAALEATYGVDAAPTGADNALLISEMTITPLDAQNIARNNIKGFFGLDEELVGPNSVRCSFTVELAGSGAAATPPAWGVLLLGCAMAEASLTTPARVEYMPVTDALKSLTIDYYDAGVMHKLLGVMGNVTLSAKAGERPTLKFDFIGKDGGATAATTTGVYTAWKKPVVMKMGQVTDVTLAATYAAGALAAGTLYPSTGLEIMFGNAVEFDATLSSEIVDISDRQMTGKTELELTPAQEVTFLQNVKDNVTQSLGFAIGTATGSKIIIHAPKVQLTNPTKVDRKGKRWIGYDLRLIPDAGNDELRLACV